MRKSVFFWPLTALSLSVHALSPLESSTKWICVDEPFTAGIGQSRLYRSSFETRPGLTNALARWWFDDTGTLAVDGAPVAAPGQVLDGLALTDRVRAPGRHVLAVEDRNHASVGGIILLLELAYADGSTDIVQTTPSSWRCSRRPATPDWALPAFDDSAWERPRIVGDAFAPPWASLADMTRFLTPSERRAYADAQTALRNRRNALFARLDQEPLPVCRVVYDRGKPLFDIGGVRHSTAFYNLSEGWNGYSRSLVRQLGHFRQAGFHLYGVGVDVRDVWRPDGSIDFARAERVLLEALDLDPDAYFLFCSSSYLPPKWWISAHPSELVEYANATVNPHETQVMRNVAAPSFASSAWRRDYSDFLRRLVAHLESTPFAKRIFAYRPDFGINHEWHTYGMTCDAMPDNGPAMTTALRDWLRAHYANDPIALRQAWNDPAITFETACVPSRAARLHTGAAPFRDPVLDRPVIDFERCLAHSVRTCLLTCNQAVKEACRGRALVGNYCGYFFGMPFPAEGWHLENDAILDSPFVDFQCSPYIYGPDARRPGEPQFARCLLESLRLRGKVALLEADNSTSFAHETYCSYSQTPSADIAILARDFCQTLCWGCGFWYFDFGNGWYENDVFAPYFAQLPPLRAFPADCSSIAEVAVVGDYESVMFTNVTPPFDLANRVTTDQIRELGHTGVPFDALSFNDLASGRARDYKVYLFPNLFYVTPEKRAVVDRLRASGKTCIWLYAPGFLAPSGASTENVRALTGFQTRRCATRPTPTSPLLAVDDPAAHDHGSYATRAHDVFCPSGILSRTALREILRARGVFLFDDDPASSLYANASLVARHAAQAGPATIRLPRPAHVVQLYPERRDLGTSLTTIQFSVPSPSTVLFHYE